MMGVVEPRVILSLSSCGFPESIDAVPLMRKPVMLDRAAFDDCPAEAFHPGCGMMRRMARMPMPPVLDPPAAMRAGCAT